ncbi:hypothetical protein PG2048B_1553 [Bifidobacterium pseudolongum subsp. globosum]|uniref:Eps11J n=1 Tax=Bifidobacterium pseudolongum subsp. globosum TaxID=1690 RepID=A0A2N3QN73_9BIFI|nr:eps11J [Bifidobacterium pseudolongum subsp. globosum]RYQ23654.1 hypothetical protein PG2048B_1553 [Bifidobacterium pseudolongum subsp. globosum]
MRILLIGPTFFGYRDRVQEEMVREGHQVECVDDRPSETTWFKSLAKISYRLTDGIIMRYARNLAGRVSKEQYDMVLYMGGMSFCFTRKQFGLIRESSNARFVAYLWDAFANCERFGQCRDLFDDIYSFEAKDCEKYDLKMRPLFYSSIYRTIPLESKKYFEYDACFIGSAHQVGKFNIVSSIVNKLESQGYRVFKYYFMPSRVAELWCKLTNRCYRAQVFQHKPLNTTQVVDIYTRSKAVIDSPQSGQSGLTMRTLETLGARRKLITANEDVMHYDFARYGDVLVWDNDLNPDTVSDFMYSTYECPPTSVLDSYSIKAFVRTLLGEAPPYRGYHNDDCCDETEDAS